jgi:hypothetical protein
MRLTNALLSSVAALGLSAGAAFAGGDSLSQHSMSQDLMSQESFQLYQQPMDSQERDYTAMPHEYEVYDVYIVPADEVVFIPFEPSEPTISGNELG